LVRFYPRLEAMKLVDYKVRIIDSKSGTAAKTRVFIESSDGDATWATVGVSGDIVEASWLALRDSVDYLLARENKVHVDLEQVVSESMKLL
jgi:2-isopropylmalate synthase